MVFPGVLRGRPGPRLATTPASQPRRSLSSPGRLPCERSRRNDAVPAALRNLCSGPRGPSATGGAASHLDGLALWRLGPASIAEATRGRERCHSRHGTPVASPAQNAPLPATAQPLGDAYRCCHNEAMTHGEVSVPVKAIPGPTSVPGRLPGGAYPAIADDRTEGNPFGEP